MFQAIDICDVFDVIATIHFTLCVYFHSIRMLHFHVEECSLQSVSALLLVHSVGGLLLLVHTLVMTFDLVNIMADHKVDPETS